MDLGSDPLALVDWEGQAFWATLPAPSVGVEFLNVGSEWAGLKRKSSASVWAPACQESSHVGNAGVGVLVSRVLLLLYLLLPLLSLKGSLIMVGWLDVCFLLVMVGSCT